ncbi:hypothetical protein [Methanoculleus caldifontis]|uniref:hypothetical protein n=1 Tax=Methanoculleus caldifontis TaxID=2651577 RepID=UPI0029371DBD|nr:hypothetical protein [Methanoculleus sp. Wushi-C6]
MQDDVLHLVLGLIVGANVRVRGVLAPGHVRGGRRSGFTLVDLDPDPRCELQGAVWADALDRLTAHPPMVWTVRRRYGTEG